MNEEFFQITEVRTHYCNVPGEGVGPIYSWEFHYEGGAWKTMYATASAEDLLTLEYLLRDNYEEEEALSEIYVIKASLCRL